MTCSECGKECRGVIEDFGIGPYEFWGYPGQDVQEEVVSHCCGAEVDPPMHPAELRMESYEDYEVL